MNNNKKKDETPNKAPLYGKLYNEMEIYYLLTYIS